MSVQLSRLITRLIMNSDVAPCSSLSCAKVGTGRISLRAYFETRTNDIEAFDSRAHDCGIKIDREGHPLELEGDDESFTIPCVCVTTSTREPALLLIARLTMRFRWDATQRLLVRGVRVIVHRKNSYFQESSPENVHSNGSRRIWKFETILWNFRKRKIARKLHHVDLKFERTENVFIQRAKNH